MARLLATTTVSPGRYWLISVSYTVRSDRPTASKITYGDRLGCHRSGFSRSVS